MVTSSKHGMNLWSEFQPCSRVMFETGKYDFGFGFIIEAPNKVENKNRFLIMSGNRFHKSFAHKVNFPPAKMWISRVGSSPLKKSMKP